MCLLCSAGGKQPVAGDYAKLLKRVQDSRHDVRMENALALTNQANVPVRLIARRELDERVPGVSHQGVVAEIGVVCKVACEAADNIPVVRVTNLARILKILRDLGMWIYGAAGEAEQSIYEADLTGPLALVLGGEGKRLRRLTRDHCDLILSILLAGSVSSLNVSVATGICLFEALRQRL